MGKSVEEKKVSKKNEVRTNIEKIYNFKSKKNKKTKENILKLKLNRKQKERKKRSRVEEENLLSSSSESSSNSSDSISGTSSDYSSGSSQPCKHIVKDWEYVVPPEFPEKVESKLGIKTHTLSIVIPASIIDNAQSFELKTYLVCQIARAAVIYQVDEIVIVESRGKFAASLAKSNPTEFFVRNLEYLETPPYLRKALFPVCPELKYSGLMNPLNTPHHFKFDEWSQFREGVVINRPSKKGRGSWVSVGLKKDCQVDLNIEEGIIYLN